MSDDEVFEHASAFEQGEVSGNVRVDKFEAYYEQLFSEVIEDGVITPEERARLDKAAETLGLDRGRLALLEQALGAAYQARHRVVVRVADEIEAPAGTLRPLALENDPGVLALHRRIHALEAHVAELERELEEARANVHVEVDFSDVGSGAETVRADPDELQRRLRHDPRDADCLRALYRHFDQAGDQDRAFCVAQALVFLDAADEQESACHARWLQPGLIRPTTSLTRDAWRRMLFHPDEELLTGEIFSVIVTAVLLGRVAALRHAKALPELDPAKRHDVKTSTVQAVRCFGWGASILGMAPPPLFADASFGGTVEMVPGIPPSTRLGKLALSGRPAEELAFLAGRHLAAYREEHFMRLLLPSIPDLEDVFLAALSIGNPGLPLNADMKRRVLPIAKAIEPILEPVLVDRLRGQFLRFVEEGGRTNLQRWATAADRTATRTGLLLSGSLAAAKRVLELEGASDANEILDDLLVFVTSERYAKLRRQIGIAVAPTP